MSTSDQPALPPEAQAVLDRADATLKKLDAEHGEVAKIPLLEGDCTVTLVFHVEDMATPIHAADEVVFQLLNNGMRSYLFLVRDETTGVTHGVLDGKMAELPGATAD